MQDSKSAARAQGCGAGSSKGLYWILATWGRRDFRASVSPGCVERPPCGAATLCDPDSRLLRPPERRAAGARARCTPFCSTGWKDIQLARSIQKRV